MNIEKMQSSQYIPMLPIKYSVVQAYIAINNPVSSEYASLVASKVGKKLKRVVVDDSDSKLAEKLRRAGMLWAPYVIVVGKREEESRAVSIRRRADGTTKVVPVDELEEQLY
jgi:threonyl-tRNA synthetase